MCVSSSVMPCVWFMDVLRVDPGTGQLLVVARSRLLRIQLISENPCHLPRGVEPASTPRLSSCGLGKDSDAVFFHCPVAASH